MNSSNLWTLLSKLGMGKIKSGSRWMTCQCPFAASRHEGGQDEHPSFGISIGDNSRFVCQACGAKGSLSGLVWHLSQNNPNKEDYWEKVFTWCKEHDSKLTSMNLEPKEDGLPVVSKELKAAQYQGWGPIMEASWVEQFVPKVVEPPELGNIPPDALAYLKGGERRLKAESIQAWELSWNEQLKRIYIPIRDWKGRLVGYTGRQFKGPGPKYFHNKGFKRDYVLFGEHKIPKKGGVGYVVEGHFDVIGLWQNGIRSPVAIMGTFPSKYQIEKLKYFFSKLVVMGDGDKAGEELGMRVHQALSTFLPVTIEQLPKGKDPDQLTFEELEAIKAKVS